MSEELGLRILVVDDDVGLRGLISSYLQANGYLVVTGR